MKKSLVLLFSIGFLISEGCQQTMTVDSSLVQKKADSIATSKMPAIRDSMLKICSAHLMETVKKQCDSICKASGIDLSLKSDNNSKK